MGARFHFEQEMRFWPMLAADLLAAIPAAPGVVALRGERPTDQPYLTRAADLRRRLTRLLAPPETGTDGTPVQSRRLNLRDRVHSIAWSVTGSEFESLLVLYEALGTEFGYPEARRRMRLFAPYCLRLTIEHAHPRVYSTNRLSRRSLAYTYGPFSSRVAAERYCDAVLDLHQLRRCYEDLEVSPAHPGCAYGEMKKCMAPCNLTCTAEEYAQESATVRLFFDTHGESPLAAIARERDTASEEMDFERAAALHTRFSRVKQAAALADELVRPLPMLRAVIVQKAPESGGQRECASLFLLQGGTLTGPESLSTLGVRAVREQTSVGSSLFAQPLMLQAVPLAGESPAAEESPEYRGAAVLARLAASAVPEDDPMRLGDHLSLLRRWYYRPEKQRAGEIFFPNPDGSWPLRRILRGAARMALGEPAAMEPTQREAAPDAAREIKTRMLHAGRPDVERPVAVLPKRTRRGTVMGKELPDARV